MSFIRLLLDNVNNDLYASRRTREPEPSRITNDGVISIYWLQLFLMHPKLINREEGESEAQKIQIIEM